MTQQQTVPIQGQIAQARPDSVQINGQTFRLTGRFIKTASLENEWQEDLNHPEETIQALKSSGTKADLLRFWQRIPDTEPKFNYYKEWREVAAMPISTHKDWWDKQANQTVRRKIRAASKQGVEVGEAPFTDELVRGIMEIFNQAPIRRGKPFWHYGKNFDTVKREMGQDMESSIFIAAYFQRELIGFIKVMFTERYGMITMILDKMTHRDKAPMYAMIGKTVEICAERRMPYLTYTTWRRGGHRQFQQSNGFARIPAPVYFVPLTFRGQLALFLRLHNGVKGLLPEKVEVWLLAMRTKWYSIRYPGKND
jgi:hypothetical protein